MKITIGLFLTAASLLGAYVYTHTQSFVGDIYEQKIYKECDYNSICALGALIIKPPSVACAQDHLITFSDSTIKECIQQSMDSLNKNK